MSWCLSVGSMELQSPQQQACYHQISDILILRNTIVYETATWHIWFISSHTSWHDLGQHDKRKKKKSSVKVVNQCEEHSGYSSIFYICGWTGCLFLLSPNVFLQPQWVIAIVCMTHTGLHSWLLFIYISAWRLIKCWAFLFLILLSLWAHVKKKWMRIKVGWKC